MESEVVGSGGMVQAAGAKRRQRFHWHDQKAVHKKSKDAKWSCADERGGPPHAPGPEAA